MAGLRKNFEINDLWHRGKQRFTGLVVEVIITVLRIGYKIMRDIIRLMIWPVNFLFFAIFIPTLYAQDVLPGYYTVNGTVKDAVIGRYVAFAGITVSDSQIGTVSNLDGEFTLKIPFLPDVSGITISAAGYRRTDFSIDEVTDNSREFLIEPYSVVPGEIVIRPANARSLVAAAINSIYENYPVVPYRLTGFYRETVMRQRDYVSISEAVVDIYKSPYNSTGDKDMFRISRGRKICDVEKDDTLLVKLQGGPHVSMLLDIVKNRDLLISAETINYYSFELVDIIKIDDISNYVIAFSPRAILNYPLYYGKLFISTDRQAITKAEFSLDLSDSNKAARSFLLGKPAGLRFNPVKTKYLVKYKEADGKYHINYLRYELEFSADRRRGLFRTGYTIVSELAVTGRSDENIDRFSSGEAFMNSAVLSDQVPVYFADDYWCEYNYIKPDQSVEAAIKKLNSQLDW